MLEITACSAGAMTLSWNTALRSGWSQDGANRRKSADSNWVTSIRRAPWSVG